MNNTPCPQLIINRFSTHMQIKAIVMFTQFRLMTLYMIFPYDYFAEPGRGISQQSNNIYFIPQYDMAMLLVTIHLPW